MSKGDFMKNINKVLEQERDQLKLVHAYQDACSNKEFKEFIETLPIEEEILIKYTSSLEDACEEYKNCKKWKNIFFKSLSHYSYPIMSKSGNRASCCIFNTAYHIHDRRLQEKRS